MYNFQILGRKSLSPMETPILRGNKRVGMENPEPGGEVKSLSLIPLKGLGLSCDHGASTSCGLFLVTHSTVPCSHISVI